MHVSRFIFWMVAIGDITGKGNIISQAVLLLETPVCVAKWFKEGFQASEICYVSTVIASSHATA